jgi:hypothetical protein
VVTAGDNKTKRRKSDTGVGMKEKQRMLRAQSRDDDIEIF